MKSLVLFLILVAIVQTLVIILPIPIYAAPLVVDRIVYSEAEDGDVLSADTNWTIAWSADVGDTVEDGQTVTMGGYFEIFYYIVYRSFVFFDTSMIPSSANITNATLSLYITMNATETPFNLTIQNGMPTYPHSPLVVGDYDKDHYSGSGGSRNTTDGCDDDAFWNITLTSTGISWINVNGLTKFALRTSLDINGTPQNNTVEYIQWGTLESGMPPRLYLTYEVPEAALYILRGAYSEDGDRDGAINVTFYQETAGSETYELDGNQTVYAEEIGICFKFDLGYNETRTYYLKDAFEEIFVIKPSEPYYQYTFTIVDYLGVSDAYLESLLNINGTDRVVERWALDLVNDIPFTFSWGTAYKLRLVCDEGTYYYPNFVAGATTSWTLTITSDMFPETPTDISNVTVWALRLNYTHIQALYDDDDLRTVWIYMAVHDLGNLTHVFASTNTTGSYLLYNWYEGDVDVHYYVNITVNHEQRGIITWAIPCPIEVEGENPWDNLTTLLGTFPFDPDQLFAVFLIMCFIGAFSWKNYPIGIIVVVIIEILLTWMGWIDLSWTWLTIALTIAIVISMAELKERMRTI